MRVPGWALVGIAALGTLIGDPEKATTAAVLGIGLLILDRMDNRA